MKKNKMMRLASWLLVLTLLTTCIISGTFAKYVTSDDAEDTARVAKWGVTTTISGALFGEHYNAFSEAESSNQISADYTGSVDGHTQQVDDLDDGKNIVAPGTKSEAMKISISGKPEVSGKIDVEVDDTVGVNYSDIWLADGQYGVMVNVTDTVKTDDDVVGLYKKGDNESYTLCTTDNIYNSSEKYYKLIDKVDVSKYMTTDEETNEDVSTTNEENPRYVDGKYYPIIWTLGNNSDSSSWNSDDAIHKVSDLKVGIETIITEENKTFDSLTDLDKAVGDTFIKWEWPFESMTADDETAVSPVVDGCDTILGNLINWKTDSEQNIGGYQVVKIGGTEDAPTYTGVTTGEKEGITGVTYATAGGADVACLTVGFNIKVTVSQTD